MKGDVPLCSIMVSAANRAHRSNRSKRYNFMSIMRGVLVKFRPSELPLQGPLPSLGLPTMQVILPNSLPPFTARCGGTPLSALINVCGGHSGGRSRRNVMKNKGHRRPALAVHHRISIYHSERKHFACSHETLHQHGEQKCSFRGLYMGKWQPGSDQLPSRQPADGL